MNTQPELEWGTPARQHEATRDALHRAVTHIVEAWQAALDDLDAVGFPHSASGAASFGGGNSGDTPTERAAFEKASSKAAAYIAETGDLVIDLTCRSTAPGDVPWTPVNAGPHMRRGIDELMAELPAGRRWPDGPLDLVLRVERLAITGDHWWPRKPPIRVGRVNSVEVCALCGDPIGGGREDPIRRVDGQPYHLKARPGMCGIPTSCYWNVWRQRRH